MKSFDLSNLRLAEGVVRDSSRENDRILLWVPTVGAPPHRSWDRVGVAAGERGRVDRGVRVVPAAAFRVERRAPEGWLAKLASKLGRAGAESSWTMPDGTPVERRGSRRTDLALAWSEGGGPLGEEVVRGLWPDGATVRRIGDGLFLVEGVQGAQSRDAPAIGEVGPSETVAEAAVRLLEEALRGSDGSRTAAATADLGVVLLNRGTPSPRSSGFARPWTGSASTGSRRSSPTRSTTWASRT
ncbi:hypothetical protein [Planctomyces sp. SH-PL62]|uniref:hypothetical protein n=1 Tax=Planctomyces sp. SH-PL62 TaxID=1636152 RepID=UPI00078C0277|nr:hypothetical protein [Planctomyces sp. SH-PL62]AMV41010.1 hypothetical protein VT85_26480 [Planctomyces sp. SH-PL62]